MDHEDGGWIMKRTSTKWLATVGLVGAVGIGTTFGLVGAAGASPHASSHVRSSHVRSAHAVTTADYSFSVSVSGLPSGAVTVTGTGAADFSTNEVSLAIDLPASVTKLIPGGSASPEVINAVLAGGTVYAEIPNLAGLVGAPWISVALPSAASTAISGVFTKVANALGDVRGIDALAKAHGATVTPLGTSTVNNVRATGTKIVATSSKSGKVHTITASLWADSSDRLVQATVATGASTKVGTIAVSATVDFTGYGSTVTITVPPSSQVKAIPLSMIESFLGKGHDLTGKGLFGKGPLKRLFGKGHHHGHRTSALSFLG
jgi:hypothetical protein